MNINSRIQWVDVFKGIVIISMVLGHATGMYNMYIYQFHMGAFFFISGYTTNLERRTLIETIFYRFFTLIIPMVFTLIVMTIFLWFSTIVAGEVNLNTPFDKDVMKQSFSWLFSEFIYNRVWISAMGAVWFLRVLFMVSVLAKIIQLLTKHRINLAMMIILFLGYLTFLFLPYREILPEYVSDLDLAFIGLVFFQIGYYCKERHLIHLLIELSLFKKLVLFTFSSVILYLYANVWHGTMDWPPRVFGGYIKSLVTVLNGSFFMILLSQAFITIPRIKNVLIYLGQNTLPILFFHFLGFRLAFGLCGIDINNFLPPPETSQYVVWVCVVISLIFCLLLLTFPPKEYHNFDEMVKPPV